MRITVLGALALTTGLATGCAVVDSDLQHRGTLSNTETSGVVLFEDGESGHAAMYGTTCVVDPDGGIAEDVDPNAGETETVVDSSGTTGDDRVLARTAGELYVLENASVSRIRYPVPGLIDARLADQGDRDLIVATTACGVNWIDVSDGIVDASISLADVDCNGMGTSLDVDGLSGTAYVDISGAIHAVTPETVTPLAEGDLFAYSGDELGLVTANAGSSEVRFVEADGTLRWSADLGGSITDVDDIGARGWVSAMVSHDGIGEFVVLDAATGALVKSFDLPGVADVVVSGNGQTVAMVVNSDVHYYTLR